jgi:hypothetical protein
LHTIAINTTYTLRDIVTPRIYNGDHLETDLGKQVLGDLINAFLDQIDGSLDATWQLAKMAGDHWNPHFESKAIRSLHDEKYNIYRIRPLLPRLAKLRILYAYDSRLGKDEFHLLAVVEKLPHGLTENPDIDRYYNYERTHPITIRVCAEYDKIGIPRFG